MPTQDEMTANIVVHYHAATAIQHAHGREWYAKANRVARSIAASNGITTAQAAAILAHLSPRTKWADNVDRAWTLAETGACKGLTRSVAKAAAVRNGAPIVDTFGKSAWKTRAFFANIMGELSWVTVDIWAARAAGAADADLSNQLAYGNIAAAYVRAAEICNIEPAIMQATVWCVVRGSSE